MPDLYPKEARESLGLNQSQMARACGVHRMTWVKWEREERTPPAAALRLIACLLWLDDSGLLTDYLEYF